MCSQNIKSNSTFIYLSALGLSLVRVLVESNTYFLIMLYDIGPSISMIFCKLFLKLLTLNPYSFEYDKGNRRTLAYKWGLGDSIIAKVRKK